MEQQEVHVKSSLLKFRVTGAGILILFLFIAGILSPDGYFWGVHHLAFFSMPVQALFLLFALFCFFLPFIPRILESGIQRLEGIRFSETTTVLLILATGCAAMFFFDSFRIAVDIYGDTRTLLVGLSNHQYTLSDAFFSKDAEPLTRYLHQLCSSLYGTDLKTTIALNSIICGGLFVVILAFFVRSLELPLVVKIIFLVLAYSLGGNQMFFGHIENYAYIYFIIVLFLIVGWKLFDHERYSIWIPVSLLVLGLRLHTQIILFIPALAYLLIRIKKKHGKTPQTSAENIYLLGTVGATLVIGALFYFFYFKAHQYLRADVEEINAKIFLPLINPLQSPHYYTLISLEHINDILQLLMYILTPGLFIVTAFSFSVKRLIIWTEPKVIFFGLASLYSLLFCITMNPLLSYVRDWDLMAFSALPFLFFTFSVMESLLKHDQRSAVYPGLYKMLSCIIGVTALSTTIFFINANPETANERVRLAGRAMFKGFYGGSSYIINVGEKGFTDKQEQLRKRIETIRALQPYAGTQDGELSNLTTAAAHLAMEMKNYTTAEEFYSLSLTYDSLNATALKSLSLCALMQKDFSKASDRIAYYNEHVNTPQVLDPNGLMVAQCINYVTYLQSEGADTLTIYRTLNSFITHIR